MDTQMSPTPTPGTDLRPTPCAEAGEEGKARWGGEGRAQEWGDKPARPSKMSVVRDRASFSVMTGRREPPA